VSPPVRSDERVAAIAEHARSIRVNDLAMVHGVGLGHLGSDFSCIDILATLYLGGVLNVDPTRPHDPERDRFVLSKGHAAGALYCTLAEAGFIDRAELKTYMAPLSRLSGHPDRRKVPGVETNTGPLGHGLSIAVGVALSARLSGSSRRTFALCGDGELQEGSMWEAVMAAAHYGLDSLTLIVDRNRLQQGDRTENTNRLEPLNARFEVFGWATREVDGHDHAALLDALTAAPFEPGKPSCLIAHTTKGKGVSFMTDDVSWHHRVPSPDEYVTAMSELDGSP
jgi:transketolase